MAKVTPITEQFQHFLEDLKDSFWGDLCGEDATGLEEVLGSGKRAIAGQLFEAGLA